jgi:dihydrofolate reductase
MPYLTSDPAISLDGFIAGPHQSKDEPLGVGGEGLHRWHWEEAEENAAEIEAICSAGAYIMGRNMFASGRGEWDLDWKGWWGDDPPYHAPVFVLTHYEREPVEMQGGTTFHFVTQGIEAALERATQAAGGKDVWLTGGADVIRQYLRAGLLDQIEVSLTPVLLGDGEPLFAGLGGSGIELEQVRAVEAPGVTHLTYRVKPDG